MAKYDSPGFADQLPGFAPRNSHDYMSAAGSASTGLASGESGPEVGSPVVSTAGVSSQLPSVRVRQVAGDTSGMSSDQAVPSVVGGVAVDGADRTGAGDGRAGHFSHPNGNGR